MGWVGGVGGPCDFSVSPSPFGLDFGTLGLRTWAWQYCNYINCNEIFQKIYLRYYNGSSYIDLCDGTKKSNCHLPCTSTVYELMNVKGSTSMSHSKVLLNILIQVSGKHLSNQRTKRAHKFDLTLNQNVIITEAYIPEFSVSSFFASLGGAFGLWLGVGAVQLCSSVNGLAGAAWIRFHKYWGRSYSTYLSSFIIFRNIHLSSIEIVLVTDCYNLHIFRVIGQ